MEATRPHKGWVRLLTVLVGIFTVLAIISTWVDRQVFDTSQWGDTSVEMLQNPAIQSAVANYAVDELYANVDVKGEIESVLKNVNKDVAPLISGPIAGFGRQGIDELAVKALQTEQIQAAWRKANEAAHKTLVDVIEDRSEILRTSGGQVRLELRPLIIEIASQVGLEKQARDNIPPSTGDIHIVDSDELATAQKVAKLIHGTALVSSLLVVLFLALAIWLSPGYRWLTFIWMGVALIIAAVVVLVLRSVGGGVVVDQLASVDVQPAARAAWDIGTELLRSIAWTMIWAAVALFVIAWMGSPTRPASRFREFLAVPFERFPAPVFIVYGLVAFLFLITAAGDGRAFLVRLAIVIAATGGMVALRFELRREFPDANFDGLLSFGGKTVDSARDLGDKTADSARGLWHGPLRGITKIFGSSKEERERAEGSGSAAVEAPAEGVEAPTAEVEKSREPVVAEKPSPRPSVESHVASAAAGEQEAPTEVLSPDPAKRFELLERLGGLRDSGVLSEEEFEAEKRRILSLDE